MSQQQLYHHGGRYLISINASKFFLSLQLWLPMLVALSSTFLLNNHSVFFRCTFFIMVIIVVYALQIYFKPDNLDKVVLNQFEIDDQGRCVLIFSKLHPVKNELNKRIESKLSVRSRVSFLGCWFYFENKATLQYFKKINFSQPWFIFRDSLTEQDYSRLARITKRLALEKNNITTKRDM